MKKNRQLFESLDSVRDKPILAQIDPSSVWGIKDREDAEDRLEKATRELSDLQYRLYAEAKTGLLLIFQAMDTGGKDGVIRKVLGPLNPQGVEVTSFKRPTPDELAHDYLWRIHSRVPARGKIGVFNRSHYEDVLVPRVHKLAPKEELNCRYRQINDFERHLGENGVILLKFYLHISKDEQKRRLKERLDKPEKNWKFEPADLAERELWDKYREAYQAIMEKCSSPHAPWYVIPSNRKWFRDIAVAEIIRRELNRINPSLPKAKEGLRDLKVK
ncbi:MAG: polyphosphate kinase 2 family protein [Planctomycetota bacterium]|jgi:PPK2 family polyphosphate:nucleotide phosphotransferase|nr:polyphosphate kinase 2 family protein [Planctomycetota bacterium]